MNSQTIQSSSIGATELGIHVSGTVCAIISLAAAVQYARKKNSFGDYLFTTVFTCLMPINLWFVEFAQTERFTPAWVVLVFTFQVISAIIFIIRVSYRNFRPVMAGLALVYTFSVALQAFSYLYWEWETTQNFNILLTHFDSFYFALGTLTTAGAGHPRDRRVGVMRPSVATSMRVPDLTSV